jgi:multisubunit Na+/H+ antiporter MnhG subunit
VLGYALAISILYVLGMICLVVGVVLYLIAAVGHRGPP